MWTIAKIKLSEIEHFKKEVIKKIGSDTLFFIPKVNKMFDNTVKLNMYLMQFKL